MIKLCSHVSVYIEDKKKNYDNRWNASESKKENVMTVYK